MRHPSRTRITKLIATDAPTYTDWTKQRTWKREPPAHHPRVSTSCRIVSYPPRTVGAWPEPRGWVGATAPYYVVRPSSQSTHVPPLIMLSSSSDTSSCKEDTEARRACETAVRARGGRAMQCMRPVDHIHAAGSAQAEVRMPVWHSEVQVKTQEASL